MHRLSMASRVFLCSIAACGAFASVARGQSDLAALHVAGEQLRDARGGLVILRGLNLTGDAKVPPFRGIDDMRELDVLNTWGVNVARVLFGWEAYEPERGHYDASYLDDYIALVDALAMRHVHVIVDFHQDGFSRYATGGCGDGFPSWALSRDVRAATPDNGSGCTSWGIQATLDADTARDWTAFYADEQGVRASYLAMLASVAGRLHDHAGVLGYDMLNEPAGDEASELSPLYADAATVLRRTRPRRDPVRIAGHAHERGLGHAAAAAGVRELRLLRRSGAVPRSRSPATCSARMKRTSSTCAARPPLPGRNACSCSRARRARQAV